MLLSTITEVVGSLILDHSELLSSVTQVVDKLAAHRLWENAKALLMTSVMYCKHSTPPKDALPRDSL